MTDTMTTALTNFIWPLRFLQASVSCVLLGLIMWAALRAAVRRWPMLASQRAVWMAAQLTIAAVFALTLAPQSARLGMLPAISTSVVAASTASEKAIAPAQMADSKAAATAVSSADTSPVNAPSSGPSEFPPQPTASVAKGYTWLASASLLWMAVYGAGLAHAVLRLLRARKLWRGLLTVATQLTPAQLRDHGAFTPQHLAQIATLKLTVLETDAALSPMLVGAWQARLLLPYHLRHFSSTQQQLIVEHELTHLRRRDPLHLALTCALRTALWFNPALHWFDRQLAWAQELSCDQLVLAGRPQQQRQNYAAALLRQLSAQSTMPAPAMPSAGVAFGGIDGSIVAARVRQMRQTAMPSLSHAAAGALAVAMAALLTAAALLQPAFAISDPAPAKATTPHLSTTAISPSASTTTSAAPAEPWRYPLDHVRITGFYAVHRGTLPTHHGIDFAAATGTPVHAVADGTVLAAGPFAEHEGRYGTVVLIAHGGQPSSLYAHLDTTAVKVGDIVKAGQLIGSVGGTGFATGPHLHFEARQSDRQVDPQIDPQLMLAGLDQLATPHALRVRRQQLGH